jgi:hypothetical protein
MYIAVREPGSTRLRLRGYDDENAVHGGGSLNKGQCVKQANPSKLAKKLDNKPRGVDQLDNTIRHQSNQRVAGRIALGR